MRIGVFRAAADGRRTAARLATLGHEAVLAPVFGIVPTGVTVQADTTDALVFTSAHAPEALAAHPSGTAHLSHLPCWCVGARTAEAARLAGFVQIVTGDGDAIRLARRIIAEGHARRLTLAVGRDRKPDLEIGLARGGLDLVVAEVYAAQAVPGWRATVLAGLAGMQAAVHYSRRSVVLAFQLANAADLRAQFRSAMHYGLSEDVRLELVRQGATQVAVAARPNEDSMLSLIGGT